MERKKKSRFPFSGRIALLLGMAPIMAMLWLFTGSRGNSFHKMDSTEFHMNTGITITLYVNDRTEGERLFRLAFDEIARIERVLEPLKGDGELQRINMGPAGVRHEMHPEIRLMLARSGYYHELSSGAFDPTIGPLKWLWDFENGGRIPSDDDLRRAMGLVDLKNVEIDGNHMRFAVSGVKLDFGAIAKGYAVDRMAATLRENGAKAALVNAGGNIVTIGRKPDNSDWVIGVRHPRGGQTILVEPAPNVAVATSGDYERFFVKDGVKYHHIIDPRTGYPADKCIAATAWTDNAMDADALSTMLFLLGPKKGIEIAESLKGVEAVVFYEKDGRIEAATTSGIAGKVKP